MNELWIGAGSALWLGILTAISPCPLATNIAAISYIGRKVGSAGHVLASGLLYTVGRTLVYLGLAVVLVASVLSVPQVAQFLQRWMPLVLGPILILVGMVLLGMIEVNFRGGGMSEGMRRRIDALGVWGALPLGAVFALAFCPTSAALFFGSLVPLALRLNSSVALPLVYGVGTALPVIGFAVLLATSVQAVGKAYQVLARLEWWARVLTGWVFIGIGIYYALRYVYEVI